MPNFRPFKQLLTDPIWAFVSFWDILASRSQTKPEISPKIGAKSKASTIRSQPYITLPYLSKKSGTSVDVKVDVKNVTEEGRRGPGSVFYVDVFQKIKNSKNQPQKYQNLKRGSFDKF